jgi:enoyl-CoA hydratase/carnithine racemase
MPTIALMNGHAFAGGLMFAMYHSYRVFNPSRGFLCLNELDFGYPLKPAMSSIFREKIPFPAVYRSLVLEAKRFGAKEALDGGIVDVLGGMDEALILVNGRKLIEKGKSGIYGIMSGEMYRETVALLEGHEAQEQRDDAIKKADESRKTAAKAAVKEWERNASGKAKL